MIFHSPTKVKMALDEVFAEIISYVREQPQENYKLIIGTDSHSHLEAEVTFVTAIIVHRVGKGGRYFYHRERHYFVQSLRQRIFYETSMSLDVAGRLNNLLSAGSREHLNVEIHLDVGEVGETKELIREVVGMVIGSGFDARIKPESYGATKVADRYTK